MAVTSIRLQPEVEQDLRETAQQLNRSRNWLVNEAVREYVARHQAQRSRMEETLAAIDSVARGEVVSGQAVHAWLDSWGSDDELPPPASGQ
ncbi:ribbon-helix-helix protein, CopG family [Lysobacter sp. GX 14042]|uniref:CopG family ribbon-helix-helix protein n=1 Tax=Lysobacter sp. GX 14042 TaxID=2907155 RepID=UPI001F385EB4|nr:ribbon-helix-helix protein, CopG family [Lysobacter sp. GX 14042]MCE7032761.1 ribbon-helix-helix protein, CopG family [Lysobacter sp. GX 14042]